MNEIKKIRNELKMTVRELSKASEVATGYISTLENDENDSTNPTKDVMTRIARALKSTVPEVFFKNNYRECERFDSRIKKK